MHKFLLVSVTIFLLVEFSKGQENTTISELKPCIECLCHARTGCYRRRNCASYSIDLDYWKRAGSLSNSQSTDERTKFNTCMQEEDCIVRTIIQYTDSFGKIDCNCDNTFDCKDRLAIHLFGDKCYNPNYGATYAGRFNECSAKVGVKGMLPKEGKEDCGVEIF